MSELSEFFSEEYRDHLDKLITGDKVRTWMDTGRTEASQKALFLTITWIIELLETILFYLVLNTCNICRRRRMCALKNWCVFMSFFRYSFQGYVVFCVHYRIVIWSSDFQYIVKINYIHFIRCTGSIAETGTSINLGLCRSWHSILWPWGCIIQDTLWWKEVCLHSNYLNLLSVISGKKIRAIVSGWSYGQKLHTHSNHLCLWLCPCLMAAFVYYYAFESLIGHEQMCHTVTIKDCPLFPFNFIFFSRSVTELYYTSVY